MARSRIVVRTFHCSCGHSFKESYGSRPVIMGKPTKVRSDVRCPQCSSSDLSEDIPYRFRGAGLSSKSRTAIYERPKPDGSGEMEYFYPGRNDFPTPDPKHYGAGWQRKEFHTLRELEQHEHVRVGKDNPHLFNEVLVYDNPDAHIERVDDSDLDIPALSEDDIGGALSESEAQALIAED